ncbi:Bis(5'-nucleosyl)-tetraphosphatase (asymmetrical) [Candidatus Paraburkholderia schumanniana]|nr:Bis(5'-nucleosyl)-tetraphosphatase (asymmetrical) [Candidatus Paraburkholderia schumannianae]
MAYDPANIFARILRGEAPCIKVCETEQSLAFMDVMPQTDGHVLVMPKEPAASIYDVSHAALAACMQTVKTVAAAVQAALQPDGLLIAQLNGEAAGQTVGHLHVHLIPRWSGVALRPHASAPADPAQLEALAQRIREALR